MNYPFSMYGRIIQIYRYEVTYQEERLLQWETREGEMNTATEECKVYLNTLEQAEELAECTGGSITELDSSAYEWLDGIEVADVPDTYAEAVKIYEMGKEAWESERDKPKPEEIIAAQEEQITDLQMALCDIYEKVERMANTE